MSENENFDNDIQLVSDYYKDYCMMIEGDFRGEKLRNQEAAPPLRVSRPETRLTVYRATAVILLIDWVKNFLLILITRTLRAFF